MDSTKVSPYISESPLKGEQWFKKTSVGFAMVILVGYAVFICFLLSKVENTADERI